MSWPVFAVLQLALSLVGACVVFVLHHRRISSENDALRTACEAAAAADDADTAVRKHITARLAEIDGDDAAAQVRKLILGHELEANASLADDLAAVLKDDTGGETWRKVRLAAWEEAASAPPLREAFDRYADIDAYFEHTPEPWPEVETTEELPDGNDLATENEALKARIEELESGKDDEDLRNLLKQFTQDSREMMACIQDLEKENAALKEQLEQQAAA